MVLGIAQQAYANCSQVKKPIFEGKSELSSKLTVTQSKCKFFIKLENILTTCFQLKSKFEEVNNI